MIDVLTCLVLIVLAGLSAEAVRLGCRRRLLTPLAVRRFPESAAVTTMTITEVPAADAAVEQTQAAPAAA